MPGRRCRRRRWRPPTARRSRRSRPRPQPALCLRRRSVAGTDDDVDRADRSRCRTPSRRSLCAPPTRYTSSTPASAAAARIVVGHDAVGVPAASRRRTSRTPATLAGHRGHQHDRRRGAAPAGHVAAGPVDGNDELAHVDPRRVRARLPSRAGPRARRGSGPGELQGGAKVRIDARASAPHSDRSTLSASITAPSNSAA